MMKSWRKRILGIIVCVSLVLGTVMLPTFADDSVPIPTGQNTWQDDDLPSDTDSPASSDEGTQSDPDSGLPIDTNPTPDSSGTSSDAPDETTGNDAIPDSTAPDGAATPDGEEITTFGDPEVGPLGEGDLPANELEAAKRMTISSDIQPANAKSGASAILSFAMSYNSAGGAIHPDPAKLRAVITSPQGIDVSVIGNDMFHFEATGTDDSGNTVTTLVFDQVPAGGGGNTFDAVSLTTTAGMLGHDSTYDVYIQWMYDQDELITPQQKCTVTNVVDAFGWNSLRGAGSISYVTANGSFVPDITIQYSLNNTTQGTSVGYAFTKSIEINDVVTVDPRMIVTAAMLNDLVWEYNGAALAGGTVEILSYQDGSSEYIKEFRVKNTITNDSLSGTPADIGNINNTVKMIFKGLRVNKDKANAATSSTGSTRIDINYALQSKNALSANIYPAVDVIAPHSSLNKTDGEGARYQELKASSGTSYNFYTHVYYYRTEYEPENPTDPGNSGRIEKHVKSVTTVNGDTSTDSERLIYANPGDKVTYALKGFGSYVQGETLQKFVVTDEFDLTQMYPVTVTPGHYAGTAFSMYVRVYIGNEEVYSKAYTSTSDFSTTVLDLRTLTGKSGSSYYNKTLDVTKISKIEFDYSNGSTGVPFGFRPYVDKEPTITAVVRNLGVQNPDPSSPDPHELLINTALVSYEHKGTAYNYDNLSQEDKNIEFNFKYEHELAYFQKQEVVETGNKSYVKIRGNNATSTTVEAGDLLEYTITFRNPSDEYARDPFFDDVYGEGLEPYIADTAPYNLVGSGYAEPFVKLVSVKNEAGYDVTAARALALNGVFIGPIAYGDSSYPGAYVYQPPDEPEIGNRTMRVRFKSTKGPGGLNAGDTVSEHYIHPGDVLTVTYVMRVTDPTKISNKFKAYGYPIWTGSPHLIDFTGGSNEGGSATPNPNKPIIRLTQTTTRDADATRTISSTDPVEDGELLNVKVVLQNSSLGNAPSLTLYGFNSTLYGYNTGTVYNDILRYIQGPVEMKIYKNTADQSPETHQVPMVNAPTAYPDTGVNWRYRSAMIFRDGGGNLSPVMLNPNMRVEFTFQVKAEGWLDDTAANLTQLIRTHAIFKDAYGTFTGTAGSSGGTGSNYGTWIEGQPSSPIMSHLYDTNTIYLSKKKVPIAQAWVYSNGSYLTLNNLAEGARPERTATNSYGVQIRNAGRIDLPITKIYVRLPENEKFKGMTGSLYPFYFGSALFDGQVLGTYNNRQVVVLTPKSSIVLKPNQYLGGLPSYPTSNYYVGIETYVDNDDAAKMIEAHVGQATFKESKLEVAFYSEGVDDILSDPSSYKIAAVTDAEKELWGGDAMGANPSKGVLRQGLTTYDGLYRAYYPYPGVTLTPLRKFTTGGTVEYKESTIPFSPTEQMAWKITAGLQDHNDYLKTLKNAVAVLKLPSSVTYTGLLETGYTGVQSHIGGDGYLYVVVPLDTLTAGQDKTLTITATLGPKYGNQSAEVFLFGSDEFYNARSGGWGSIDDTANFPADIRAQLGMTPSAKMVKNAKSINVSGKFAFNSKKTVSVPGGTNINRGMAAPGRTNQVLSYELILSNEGSDTNYENVTIIDRLPVAGDKFVLVDETNRGSTTKATVKTTPAVQTASLDANGNVTGTWSNLSTSQYKVQYISRDDVGPTTPFTNADFRIDDGTPSTESNWIDAASWPAGKEAAAFRILITDPLAAKKALRVTYTADAPEEDMPKQGAVAVNSFAAGFLAKLGGTDHKIKPEPDFAQVTFPDIQPMVIEGAVFTEDDDKVDGIYQSGTDHLFSDFVNGAVKLTLYKADDDQGTNRAEVKSIALNPANSVYKFDELYDPGVYTVEITGIPNGYVIYEEIVDNPQGNQFDTDGKTAAIPYEEGKTHRRNADILKVFKGTLVLQKKLTESLFSSDDGKVGGKDQKFVFKIEYTPIGESAPTQIFYEVLTGNGSRTVVDLPRGTYAVTEMAGWATGFEQVGGTGYTDDNNLIDRKTPEVTAICINQRTNRSFLHAIGEALNKFNDK